MESAMPAYMIALNRSVHNREKLVAYWNAAPATFEGMGIKVLATYTPLTPLELQGPLAGAVVIEFPDVATARRWYDSPAYQKAKQLRDGAADAELFIIDGGRCPVEERLLHTNRAEDLKTRVEQVFSAYMENIGKQDAKGMAALYAADGILVNPSGPQTDLVKFYGDNFKAGINRAEIKVDQAWPLGSGAALSIGTFRATGKNPSGAPIEVTGPLTATFVEEKGKLRIRLLNVIPQPPAPAK
jgi:uncharacterized protein (DUF1330 family)/ketosteroid isomerase-like protein